METTNSTDYTLITGASSGIGYELARLFAEDGDNLVLVARNEDALHAVAEELRAEFGVDVIVIAKDLFLRESPFEIYQELAQRGVTVNTLVNDAGQGQYGEFIDTDLHRELDIIELNVCSVVALTKLFLQDMVAAGRGRILNLSSIASKAPGPYQAVYHGTKAFIQSFTEGIRDENRDRGVTITALLPGATDTDFFHKADMEESKIVQETKLSDPADVARDGHDALLAGDDMVISGFKNKVMVAMHNMLSDKVSAARMRKTQEPVSE